MPPVVLPEPSGPFAIALTGQFHLIAPDYPGFGNSSMPDVEEWDYTFDHVAAVVDSFTEKLGLNKISLYMMDYGAPVGYRIAAKHPERIESLIVQNGNAYEEGAHPYKRDLNNIEFNLFDTGH